MYILLRLLKCVAMLKHKIEAWWYTEFVAAFWSEFLGLVAAKILHFEWSLIDASEYSQVKADTEACELCRLVEISKNWFLLYQTAYMPEENERIRLGFLREFHNFKVCHNCNLE